MSETEFLNVAFDVESKHCLDALAREMEKSGTVTYLGSDGCQDGNSFRLSFEPVGLGGPSKVVESLCELLEGLSPLARRAWEASNLRVFDLGFNSGSSPYCAVFAMKQAMVSRMANLKVEVKISIYALPNTEKPNQQMHTDQPSAGR